MPEGLVLPTFGLEMLMKSVVCGWILTYEPLGSAALRRRMMSPSASVRFCIICSAAATASGR